MTTEIDAEGWEAAMRAFDGHHIGNTADGMNTYYGLSAGIRAYLATTRTSEAEPVAWLIEQPLRDGGKALRLPLLNDREEMERYRKHNPDVTLVGLCRADTLPTPASDDQVEAVLGEVQFLLDRLNDFENVLYDDHEAVRDWSGNVAPAVSRTSNALAAMGSTKP